VAGLYSVLQDELRVEMKQGYKAMKLRFGWGPVVRILREPVCPIQFATGEAQLFSWQQSAYDWLGFRKRYRYNPKKCAGCLVSSGRLGLQTI
jgi:hypothetical protein